MIFNQPAGQVAGPGHTRPQHTEKVPERGEPGGHTACGGGSGNVWCLASYVKRCRWCTVNMYLVHGMLVHFRFSSL